MSDLPEQEGCEMMNIEMCRAVPDDSPILVGVPDGMVKMMDGIIYVPQSRWIDLLARVCEIRLGKKAAEKFRADVTKGIRP